jgi:hypothetical protein
MNISTFSLHKHLIMACHITGVYDVNRNNTLKSDDYTLVKDWAESIADLKLNGLIFHNNFTEETCKKYENEYISFIKVDYDAQFNPNIYRYLVYQNFLNTHAQTLESLFVTDVSDVVTLNNPFIQPLFVNNPNTIFCGDEPKTLNNDWMNAHSAHLRQQITDYAAYENAFQEATLLNCGIIGGQINVMKSFIDKLCAIHKTYNSHNKTAYTGDMGAFNYLIRKEFNDRLLHGSPVNTVFKAYEENRVDCWFRHK